MPQAPAQFRDFKSLLKVVEDLLGPDGCPWDKEQTPKTLTPFTVEEAFELVEAIEQDNRLGYIEELGDLLLQVVLHSKLAEKEKRFSFDDVVETLVTKLVTRHTHVFGENKAKSATEALSSWDSNKRAEKAQAGEPHDPLHVPFDLPALQRAHKLGEKAKKEAFDWTTWQEVLEKVDEEIVELNEELKKISAAPKNEAEALDKLHKVHDEMGDVFFVLSQLARKLKFNAETVARAGNRKFETRFRKLLKYCTVQGIALKDLSIAEKEKLWQQIKNS